MKVKYKCDCYQVPIKGTNFMFWHALMVTFSATVYCQVFCDLPSIHGVCHVNENSSTRFDE
jgi:hypothetical protein